MRLIYYGHSCFKLEWDENSIVFDPYQNDSVPNLKLPKLSANRVIVSHEHHDHNARELVDIINKDIPCKLYQYEIAHDKANGLERGMNKITVVDIDGLKIAHFGDIGVLPNDALINKLSGLDVILVPINGFYTISAKEAKQLYNLIRPNLIIPMHYYNRETNSGYPDNNQIDIFKKLFPNFKEIKDNTLELKKGDKGAYIFK